MQIDDKLAQACTALGRIENRGRRLNARHRRRACYWIKRVDQLEARKERDFQKELWGSIFDALESGKIQTLTVIR